MADEELNQINLRTAEIKDYMFLKYSYTEDHKKYSDKLNRDSKAPVHDDMKLAFKRLNIHLALLSQQVTEDRKKGMQCEAYATMRDNGTLNQLDPDNYFQFTEAGWDLIANTFCTSFSLSSYSDSIGVSLSGSRTFCDNGYTIALSSPTHKSEDPDKYKHTSELFEVIEDCKHEVLAYLDGKHAPEVQGDLFDDGEEEQED